MDRMGMEEGEPIEHGLITRAVANAQSKVEGHNFDIRKHLLEYDDVLNQQREIVFGRRRDILADANLRQEVLEMAENVAAALVEQYAVKEVPPEEWDWNILGESLLRVFNLRLDLDEEQKRDAVPEQLTGAIVDRVHAAYGAREQAFTPPVLRQVEKLVMLQTLDALWKDHLLSMDHLKEGIGLRGYAQKNPLQEYKKEGFSLFGDMMSRLEADVTEKVFTVQLARQEDVQRLQQQRRPHPAQMTMSGGGSPPAAAQRTTVRREADKAGRNDPCPCGSGKKYKKCHGT
jgi:preprotein translocase subunit SecA